MAYSNFTLDDIKLKLGVVVKVESGLFAGIPPQKISDKLAEILSENVELALIINTEKARSELIIAPVLLELRRTLNREIGFYSGVEFNVSFEKGLNGFCDFILTKSEQNFSVSAPIVTLVEAKNGNLQSGFPQCIAEMKAAQILNQQEQNPIEIIFGVVTTGSAWSFMKLEKNTAFVDPIEHSIENVHEIFAILLYMIEMAK